MTRDEARAIFADVKANSKRLDECPRPHEFEPMEPRKGRVLLPDYWCKVCGGTVDATRRRWYELGLEDARKVGDPKT